MFVNSLQMAKSNAERMREYRRRKKETPGWKERESERKRMAYQPVSTVTKKEAERRRKVDREKWIRRQDRKRQNTIKTEDGGKSTNGFRLTRKRVRKEASKLRNQNKTLKVKLETLSKDQNRLRVALFRTKKLAEPDNDESIISDSLVSAMTSTPSSVKKLMAKKMTASMTRTRNSTKIFKVLKMRRHRDKIRTNRKTVLVQTAASIGTFLKRPDNARCMPGKKDFTKMNGSKEQKYLLLDFMQNLHAKFCEENPIMTLSYQTFCRFRPKNIILVDYTSKNCCLCTYCQNFIMKVKAIQKEFDLPLSTCSSPERFLSEYDVDQCEQFLATREDDVHELHFQEWKRVQITAPKGARTVTRLQNVSSPCNEFLKNFLKDRKSVEEHTKRAAHQYHQYKLSKDNLLPGQILLHMDFAENYVCTHQDEIQSAHWNACSVTIHPAVVYYKLNGLLLHKSLAIISDTPFHNAETVYAFLKTLMTEIKALLSEITITKVFYWTDSPNSQYRNFKIFALVAEHNNIFGVPCTWNYFEVSHGKGPCDGIGGVLKRDADRAVKHQKVILNSAEDFFAWTLSSTSSKVKTSFVSNTTIDICKVEFNALTTRYSTVKNTMKVCFVVILLYL